MFVECGSHVCSAEFEIRESLDGGRLRLTLLGELDLASRQVLESRLEELQLDGRPVLLDLSQLEFMDSTGLAIVTGAIKSSRTGGWPFVIGSDLSPQVQRLFRLTGLDEFAGLDGNKASSA